MKMLDKLLRRVPADLLDAESAFSRDDRKAIVREFAEADAIEPELGAAIARYIIEGEGESVMLRITALLAKGGEAAEMLKLCLLVPRYAPRGLKLSPEDIDKRLTLRRRILIDLDGFDAAGMRRLGLVQAKAASWLYNYGTDRSPFWLRALSQASDTVRAYRSGHEERPPFLNALFVRDMLAVEGLSVGPLVDLMFGGPRYGQKKPEERMAVSCRCSRPIPRRCARPCFSCRRPIEASSSTTSPMSACSIACRPISRGSSSPPAPTPRQPASRRSARCRRSIPNASRIEPTPRWARRCRGTSCRRSSAGGGAGRRGAGTSRRAFGQGEGQESRPGH